MPIVRNLFLVLKKDVSRKIGISNSNIYPTLKRIMRSKGIKNFMNEP